MRATVRPGFTLLELVVASFVFAVGILALEAMAASALQRMRRSAQLTAAASVARSRLEVLGSSRCVDLAAGTDTVGLVISRWTVEETGMPDIRAVAQTVTYTIDGAERADTYRSMVPCSE